MRRARDANPRFFEAHWMLLLWLAREGRRDEGERDYAARAAGGDPEMQCLAIAAARPAHGSGTEWTLMATLARSRGIGACTAFWIPELMRVEHDPAGLPTLRELRIRATTVAPKLARPWENLATSLLAQGDTAAADSVLRVALRHVTHPMERVAVLARRATLHEGPVADARWRALEAAVARDGRPGMRVRFFDLRHFYRPADAWVPGPDVIQAAASASLGVRGGMEMTHAQNAISRGDFVAAMPHFDRALAMTDSMSDGQNFVATALVKGRALSKMGRLRDAELTLLEAYRRARGTHQRYSLAEIWHNLSHTYESLGAHDKAVAASDSFVAFAAGLERDPIRIMSRHDAALLRLSLGWHAAAGIQFAAMVRLVDSERQNHYWAGEYFERVGDVRAALSFYQRGAALDKGERSLNLAGLARAYEALGLADSAARAAADHDRNIQTPTEVPLAPEILSRDGRHDEAVRLARAWAERREAGGSIQGAALARLQTAGLLLAARRPAAAADEARRALRHATSLQLDVERIEALRLVGTAARALGDPRAGMAAAREAAARAIRRGDLRLIREAHVALAALHADLGATDSAFAAYDRAARTVESGAAALHDDIDRVRFRAAHLAPFDAALGLALRIDRDGRGVDRVAYWSARRKAAALLLAARRGAAAERVPSLAELHRELADDHALVDYVVLPDVVAALVVRRGGTRLIRLAIPTDTIAALARRLTLSFARRGRSVDMARASFDTDAAQALFDGVVAPLRGGLEGATRITLIPDGPLHHVPFAALTPDRDRDVYLLDELEIDHALSLAAVDLGARRDWRAERVLLVQTNVPGAAEERAALHATWASRVLELADAAATEPALPNAVARAGIVHFATHAEASDRDPLTTHLRLAPAPGSDGLLHVGEIAPRSYERRLVVLASCESLVGPLVSGEGFVGLTRSFVAAGASGVVATRWPIGATAASFSRVFYDALAAGRSHAAATRDAQLALRRRPETAHPFYWGGYVAMQGIRPTRSAP